MDSQKYFDKWAEYYKPPIELPFFLEWNLKNILRHIPKKGSPTVLDLGTGNGILLAQIGKHNRSCKLIGLDFSQSMLNQAEITLKESRLEARLVKSELTNIPLKNNSVDYVVSNNALHHIKDKKKLYSKIYRILKSEGVLVYSDSHDTPDEEFEQAKREWIVNDKKFARRYKESADKTWLGIPECIRKNHPKEYHSPFKEVRMFLRDVGFKNIKIIPSPSYFAIVYAEKNDTKNL